MIAEGRQRGRDHVTKVSPGAAGVRYNSHARKVRLGEVRVPMRITRTKKRNVGSISSPRPNCKGGVERVKKPKIRRLNEITERRGTDRKGQARATYWSYEEGAARRGEGSKTGKKKFRTCSSRVATKGRKATPTGAGELCPSHNEFIADEIKKRGRGPTKKFTVQEGCAQVERR